MKAFEDDNLSDLNIGTCLEYRAKKTAGKGENAVFFSFS